MSQPSGRVCDAPAHVGFWMRVSPVICVADTIAMAGRMVWYFESQGSFDAAIDRIITERFYFDDPSPDTLASFRHNAPLRWVAFALAIFQAAKLFATSGLVWIKVWTAMYLLSFLVTEMLVVLPHNNLEANTNLRPQDMPPGSGYRSFPYIAATLSAPFALYFASLTASSMFHYGLLQCIAPTILVLGAAPFAAAAFFAYIVRGNPRDFLPSYLFTLAIIVWPTIFFLTLLQSDPESMSPPLTIFLAIIMILSWSLLSLPWATITFRPVIDRSREDTRHLESGLAVYFFILHLLTAVLFFRYGYSSKGTALPEWAQYVP